MKIGRRRFVSAAALRAYVASVSRGRCPTSAPRTRWRSVCARPSPGSLNSCTWVGAPSSSRLDAGFYTAWSDVAEWVERNTMQRTDDPHDRRRRSTRRRHPRPGSWSALAGRSRAVAIDSLGFKWTSGTEGCPVRAGESTPRSERELDAPASREALCNPSRRHGQ